LEDETCKKARVVGDVGFLELFREEGGVCEDIFRSVPLNYVLLSFGSYLLQMSTVVARMI